MASSAIHKTLVCTRGGHNLLVVDRHVANRTMYVPDLAVEQAQQKSEWLVNIEAAVGADGNRLVAEERNVVSVPVSSLLVVGHGADENDVDETEAHLHKVVGEVVERIDVDGAKEEARIDAVVHLLVVHVDDLEHHRLSLVVDVDVRNNFELVVVLALDAQRTGEIVLLSTKHASDP